MYQLSFTDTAIIVAYLVITAGVGLFAFSKSKNADDYYVGGRRSGMFTLGCLWMASWIGGATVIGSVDKAYEVGISAVWYCGSMAIGCVIFAYTSTGIIQKLGAKFSCLTYPQLIEMRYGPSCRMVATITTLLAYIAYTAGQFLAQAKILEYFLGWDLTQAIIVSAVSMIVYTALGGFIAVSITGVIQALIILGSLALVMAPVLAYQVTEVPIPLALPEGFFSLGSWGWTKILGISVTIILTFYTSMDSYTRCFAAKNVKAARNGTLLAALLVLIISLSTTFIGMSGRMLTDSLPEGISTMSALINISFPSGVKGIIIVGLLAAIMSTGAVCLLVASANITQDITKRFLKPTMGSFGTKLTAAGSTIVIGAFASYLAIVKPNVIDVLYIAFTVNSASLFIPTIAMFFWKRGSALAATTSMSLSLVTVIFWYIGSSLWPGTILFTIDPIWPGLAVSATAFGLCVLLFPQSETDQEKIVVFYTDAVPPAVAAAYSAEKTSPPRLNQAHASAPAKHA